MPLEKPGVVVALVWGRTPYVVFKAGIPKKSPARAKTSRKGGQAPR